MGKKLSAALLAAVVLSGLTACTSHPTRTPTVRVPSVAAHLATTPDDAPVFTDLTQKPFVADGTGPTVVTVTPPTGTKSVSYFVSCTAASKYWFEVYSGTKELSSGGSDNCEGVNLSGYGANINDGKEPTAIHVHVAAVTRFEVTAYWSADAIRN